MNSQAEILEILNQELTRIRARNPSYSMRSYAKKLKIPPSGLSGILSGKLPVTKRVGQKILQQLCIDPIRSENLLNSLNNKNTSKNKNQDRINHFPKNFMQVNMDHYHLISDWWYFAILSLAETDYFQEDPEWIAKRLNIGIPDIKIALQRLERLKLLVRSKSGKLKSTGYQFKTTSNITNLSLRKSHLQTIELIKNSIERDDLKVCDFSSMTMAIDPDKLPEAKLRLTEFRRSLCSFLESGKKKEVYRLFLSLFPLTEMENGTIIRKEVL
jgi:uncharacterized protein (TIGR02147 family)